MEENPVPDENVRCGFTSALEKRSADTAVEIIRCVHLKSLWYNPQTLPMPAFLNEHNDN